MSRPRRVIETPLRKREGVQCEFPWLADLPRNGIHPNGTLERKLEAPTPDNLAKRILPKVLGDYGLILEARDIQLIALRVSERFWSGYDLAIPPGEVLSYCYGFQLTLDHALLVLEKYSRAA